MKYNQEERAFEQSNETNKELFEKGNIAYVPMNLMLKESELIGAENPYNDDALSDKELDFFIEDESEPFDDFKREIEDLFATCIQQ